MATITQYHKTKQNTSNNQIKQGGVNMSELFTCYQVAERYGVKTLTVWDWIRKKKLPAIKLGRDYRIRQEDIEAFERERMTVQD